MHWYNHDKYYSEKVPYDIGIGTKSDVAIGIINEFKENNIEIPFPQVDFHMKHTKEKTNNWKVDHVQYVIRKIGRNDIY